jgi:hypothetical protein
MSVLLVLLRWFARLSSLLVAVGCIVIVIGDITEPPSDRPSALVVWDRMDLNALMAATCVGMLIWRWELPGAIISLASLLAFTLIAPMGVHSPPIIFAVPGVLYMADWLLRRPRALKPMGRNSE